MYSRVVKHKVPLFMAVVLIASVFIIPFSGSSDADELAQADDISVSPSMNNISINAGETVTIYLDIYNKFSRDIIVYVYYDGGDRDIDVEFPHGHRIEVASKDIGYCELHISVDKYARSTDHALSFDISINDPLRGTTVRADASNSLMITVHSQLSSGDQYNKILGIFDNHLPYPLNTPLATMVITMLIWIFFAIILAYYVLPVLIRLGKRAIDDTDKIMKRWKK